MSVEDHPFRWVPSLQHIATVKTVQMLWRNSEGKASLVDSFRPDYCAGDRASLMIQPIKLYIDQLQIARIIKNDLKNSLIQMVASATGWLMELLSPDNNFRYEPYENQYEIIAYCIDNFCWNDMGCVDGRTMVQSYVSNKETISFAIWHQLCFYCIEDDIIRLAGTIDWENCEQFDNSRYDIYWYRRIYGEFPRERMFRDGYPFFEFDRDAGLYDEDNVMKNMFERSACYYLSSAANISAAKYFRNHLRADEDLYGFFENFPDVVSTAEIAVYFLRTMQHDTAVNFFNSFSSSLLEGLAKWPWVLFIDNWMSVLENVLPDHFLSFFHGIIYGRYPDTSYRSNCIQGVYNTTLYDPFKKLWTLYYRRFGTNEEIVRQGFKKIFDSADLLLCRIIFDRVESHRRRIFIQNLKDYVQEDDWLIHREEFLMKFPEKVLGSDEERQLFLGPP